MMTEEQSRAIRERTQKLMVQKDNALLPPEFLRGHQALNGPDSPYADERRTFQGIPSIDITPGGRLYTVFYTGTDTEGAGNYLLLQYSDDRGQHFSRPFLAVIPRAFGVRCFDPVLWSSPDGRLHLFWNQSFGFFDGRSGVWCATCGNPDDPQPSFAPPRRVANGVMMCKPIALHNGQWLLPAAVWRLRPYYDQPDCDGHTGWHGDNRVEGFHHLPDEISPNVYRSTDRGESWTLYGRSKTEWFTFPEHMVAEKRDGSLAMYIRAHGADNRLGYAESTDGGATWTEAVSSPIYNPNSRFCLRRLPSGRLMMINHALGETPRRDNLAAFLSEDDGKTWSPPLIIDERPGVSYPDLAISPDGWLYIIYDYNRYTDKEILLCRIREEDVLAGRPVNPHSRLRIPVNRALGINPGIH